MRLLSGPDAPREVSEDDLATLYARPDDVPADRPWLLANFVSTVDGAITGPDGLSTGINNDPDHRVFATLRAAADAVLVGAGTAREEEYAPIAVPLVLVSRRGEVPDGLRGADPGRVLLATSAASPGLAQARDLLGADHVVVSGQDDVDLAGVRRALAERGLLTVLCEGGPALLGSLLDAGELDELCTTTVPLLVGGDLPRMVAGPDVEHALRLAHLLEEDGTLMARWRIV